MRNKVVILLGALFISILLVGCGEDNAIEDDAEVSAVETEDTIKEENEEEVHEESVVE